MKKSFIVIVVIAAVAAGAWFFMHRSGTGKTNATADANKSNVAGQGFNKKQYSLTDPSSIWIIANKHSQLSPKGYAPSDLVAPNIPLRLTAKDDEMKMRKIAADALKQMYDGAQLEGLKLMVSSGYRSYNFQVSLYNRYVQQQGKAVADSQSARPGFSEHQTGLAVDVEPASRKCEVEACFAKTPEGQWVAMNAYKYGFIVRYQLDKQDVTGYIYEPWHLRYVGKDLAAELHKQNDPTLEEFFGLKPAPDYL
jgi:D-alanyl-D-alanine carboxypeptidase